MKTNILKVLLLTFIVINTVISKRKFKRSKKGDLTINQKVQGVEAVFSAAGLPLQLGLGTAGNIMGVAAVTASTVINAWTSNFIANNDHAFKMMRDKICPDPKSDYKKFSDLFKHFVNNFYKPQRTEAKKLYLCELSNKKNADTKCKFHPISSFSESRDSYCDGMTRNHNYMVEYYKVCPHVAKDNLWPDEVKHRALATYCLYKNAHPNLEKYIKRTGKGGKGPNQNA